MESHIAIVDYLRQPIFRLEYIECVLVGHNHNLFKVRVMLMVKRLTVDIFDLLTKRDWQIITSHLDAICFYTGTDIEGLDGILIEALFQASIQAYLADPVARFKLCQGVFLTIFFSRERT